MNAASWHRLFDSLPPAQNTIIRGDFNSHHTCRGCSINCNSGTSLSNSLIDYDLTVLNDGSPTRITPPNTNSSALVLTLISPFLLPSSSWLVQSDSLTSDHFPIVISVGVSFSTLRFSSDRFPLKKVDWSVFSSHLSSLFSSNPITQYQNSHLSSSNIILSQ